METATLFVVALLVLLLIVVLRICDRLVERLLDGWLPLDESCCCDSESHLTLVRRLADLTQRPAEATTKRYIALLRELRNETVDYLAGWPDSANAAQIGRLRDAINDVIDFEEKHISDNNTHPLRHCGD